MSERMGLPPKNLEKSSPRAVLEVGGGALSLVIITQMTRVSGPGCADGRFRKAREIS